MAFSFHDNNEGLKPAHKPSTTFVQANPSNFQAVVQQLTGATTLQQHTKKPALSEVGGLKSGHKLYERRKSGRKLEITVKKVVRKAARERVLLIASSVSTLDGCGTPLDLEEEKGIAEKGFYLHPSPIRGHEPELLVLFPLNSPKTDSSYSSL